MENPERIPTICIVGRPNVGKSSLFNCLLGERRAVVVEQSGTTRDKMESVIDLMGRSVKIVDTGGYLSEDKDCLSMQVKDQIYVAMEEATIILMVVDTISGVTPADREVALLLRRFNKTVILAANKTDNEKLKEHAVEFYQLGLGDPVAISCTHRRGLSGLKRMIFESMEHGTDDGVREEEAGGRKLHIAIVGRPNVGKSSFVNYLLKRNRVIVSDIPGTTRDSIDTYFKYDDEEYILIDTAGIRHKRKIKEAVDVYSIMRSKESIERADVVMLMIDASSGVTRDDMGILNYVEEKGKPCLILINKWDLADDIDDVSPEEYTKHLLYASNHLRKYPINFVSALTGKNILETLKEARILDSNVDFKASTPFLNRIFERKSPSEVAVPRRKRRPNFLYIVQSSTRPVEFKFFVNDPASVLPSHLSFIENQLRANLPLQGIPIKINIRGSRKGIK